MRKNSVKNTRINGEVLKELSNIIRGEIKDPRINPMTSVVSVEVAPDLKTCKAYISVLGDKESQEDTMKGLKVQKDISAGSLQRISICATHRKLLLFWTSPLNTVSICQN